MKTRITFSLLHLLLSTPLLAQWQPDGIAACGASAHQLNQVAVANTTGAIVVWEDYRSGDTDIYARKVNAAGTLLWQTNGVAVCSAHKIQMNLAAVSDGSGGVIVVWEDYRNNPTGPDLFAQRISSTGSPLWNANGVPVCVASGVQMRAAPVSDGQGGVIIAWEDYRGGPADIYAQRVASNGLIMWQTNGLPIAAVAGARYVPVIGMDGSGGAIIAWEEIRGTESDIFAQRINVSGVVQWTNAGIVVCAATGVQTQLAGYSTGTGNLLLAWQDYRTSEAEIYGQILTPTGVLWPGNGVGVCVTSGTQERPKPVPDGTGGMIVAWTDYRGADGDIYARRITSAGFGQWRSDGVPLCTNTGTQHEVSVVANGVGGAIVVWMDYRVSTGDIYAQLVDVTGYSLWQNNGSPVCTQSAAQHRPLAVSDYLQGTIVAWTDYRSTQGDIFVQRINRFGVALPVELVSFSGEHRPDGVLLRWRTASESNMLGFEVQIEEAGAFRRQGFVAARFINGGDYEFLIPSGASLVFRLRSVDYDGSETFSQVLRLSGTPSSAPALVSMSPLPARELLTIVLDAPAHLPLRIAVYDLTGRKHIAMEETTTLGGREVRTLDVARLPAGMYVLEIAHAGSVHTALFPVQR